MKTWDSLTVHDARNGVTKRYRLDDRHAALYELCADAKGIEEVTAAFEDDSRWVESALGELVEKDLMLFLDDQYLSLALPANRYH